MSGPLPGHALRKLLHAAEPLLDELREGPERRGRYRIVRELGRGGMGVVYEAEDRDLGRRVALKVLALPPGVGDELRERFQREALAAARLSHPNIAAVYDATGDSIAMQLVDGVPLSLHPRADRRRLVTFVRDAAVAVHYAHERGVIHRDLKPHNLLVEGERVVVTDFGLAKERAADSSLSLSGHILGTPAFMAPEQAEGRVRDVDPRTDVYGLGATLFDLLAGRPPFADRDVMRLLRRVCEDPPPAVRSLARDVPRDLELVVLKCLAKEKERRYATARDLADDLTRWLDGRPVLARPPSVRYRVAKFVQRRRAVVAVALVSLVALLAAGLVTLDERAKRRVTKDALVLSREVDAVLADAEMYLRVAENEQAVRRLQQGIARCRGFLAEREVADAHYLLGRLLRAHQRHDEALAALDRALELEPGLVEARVERGFVLAARLSSVLAERLPPVAADDVGAMTVAARRLRERALADLSAVHEAGARLRRADDRLYALAELARLRGDRAAAERGFEEALRLNPLRRDVKISQSRLLLAEGRTDDAWHSAMSAVDIQRGFGPAYVARSAAPAVEDAPAPRVPTAPPVELPGTDALLADFAALVELDPSDARAFGLRGVVHARRAAALAAAGSGAEALDVWAAAEEAFSGALTLEPGLAAAWNDRAVARMERARLLAASGRHADAEAARAGAAADLDAAVRRAPALALARLNRSLLGRRDAAAHLALGETRSAAAALERSLADASLAVALDAGPAALLERALVHELRSRVHLASGAGPESAEASSAAAADLRRALALDPAPELRDRVEQALAALR